MDQDATCYEGMLRPRPQCVTGGPSFTPPQKRSRGPNFRPVFIVAKWSPISATATLLYCRLIAIVVQRVFVSRNTLHEFDDVTLITIPANWVTFNYDNYEHYFDINC